jgi:hypothetical protein
MREPTMMGKSEDRVAKKPAKDIEVGSFGGQRHGGRGQRRFAIESGAA